MTNIHIYPDSTNELENDYPNQPDENENNRKFPDDDSNVGDNPIYPNKDDEVPTNENIPSEIENDDVSNQTSENDVEQEVGSGKGGVYPYNINSNTADDEGDEDENGIEPKLGPIDTNEDQDFENPDQDSENSHQI
jgi:hypothetical protein